MKRGKNYKPVMLQYTFTWYFCFEFAMEGGMVTVFKNTYTPL